MHTLFFVVVSVRFEYGGNPVLKGFSSRFKCLFS